MGVPPPSVNSAALTRRTAGGYGDEAAFVQVRASWGVWSTRRLVYMSRTSFATTRASYTSAMVSVPNVCCRGLTPGTLDRSRTSRGTNGSACQTIATIVSARMTYRRGGDTASSRASRRRIHPVPGRRARTSGSAAM